MASLSAVLKTKGDLTSAQAKAICLDLFTEESNLLVKILNSDCFERIFYFIRDKSVVEKYPIRITDYIEASEPQSFKSRVINRVLEDMEVHAVEIILNKRVYRHRFRSILREYLEDGLSCLEEKSTSIRFDINRLFHDTEYSMWMSTDSQIRVWFLFSLRKYKMELIMNIHIIIHKIAELRGFIEQIQCSDFESDLKLARHIRQSSPPRLKPPETFIPRDEDFEL